MKLLLILLLIVSWRANAQAQGPVITDAELLTVSTFPGAEHASFYWCGNRSTKYRLGMADPMPWSQCVSLAKEAGNERAAHPHSEIRGWVRNFGGNRGEVGEELVFELEVDAGWQVTSGATTPINTLQRIMDIATPAHSLSGPALVHIEMNGWGPCRTCGVARDPLVGGGKIQAACAKFMSERGPEYCANYKNRPRGWETQDPDQNAFQMYWPFDPHHIPTHSSLLPARDLSNGDYVRVVGTLWEDGNHGQNTCWFSGRTSDRGWPEIHPVDFIARIPAPTGRPSESGIRVLGLCIENSNVSRYREFRNEPIKPTGDRSGRCRIDWHEAISAGFTNYTTIAPEFGDSTKRVTLAPSGDH